MSGFTGKIDDYVLVLSQSDRDYLDRYGPWMESLISGETEACTERQKHFVSAVFGNVLPKYNEERLWMKYQKAEDVARKSREAIESVKVLGERVLSNLELIRELYGQIAWYKSELERQADLIKSLQARLRRYEPKDSGDKNAVGEKAASELTRVLCRVCNGDGSEGRCFRCGGNGLEP